MLFQRFHLLFQLLPTLDLRTEIFQLIHRNILLPPFLILRPAVVEVFLSVDGFLHNIASRQSRNLLLQLRRLFLHFRQIHSVPLCDTIILCRIIPYYTLKLRV